MKTDQDRIDEATALSKLMSSVPGQTVKREISKSITQALLGGKVSVETIAKVNAEIDDSVYTTSDPNTISSGCGSWIVWRTDWLDGSWFQQGRTYSSQDRIMRNGPPAWLRRRLASRDQTIQWVAIRPLAECLICRRTLVPQGKRKNRVGTVPYTIASVGAFEAGR